MTDPKIRVVAETTNATTNAVVPVVKKKKGNPLSALTAGCIAGGIEATAVWPMEYIKTQLQLHSKVKGNTSSTVKALPYNGMISGLKYTIQTTGFFSLYQGLVPTLIGSIPKAGIRFGLNAQIKDMMIKDPITQQLSAYQNFIAGMGAGVAEAIIIVAPVETIKTKCIELNMNFISGMKHIIQTDGIINGIYQGSFATALKQGSNQGLRFMWFNEYKRIITSSYKTDDGQPIKMTPLLGLLGGMSAGCFSTIGNNPFDVIKTRMQGTQAKIFYKNTLDCFYQILNKEGVLAFYSGIIPRLGRVVPGQGIIFMSFESIQQSLQSNFTIMQ